MWATRYIENASKLTVTVHLCNGLLKNEETHHLTTKGIVVRAEPQTDGSCGIAVKFNHYRFT